MREARRPVFVLRVEIILSVEHQTKAEREKSLHQSRGLRVGAIPSTESFDSRRMAEKEPVGIPALMSLTGEISSAGRTDTVLRVGKIHQ